MNSALGMHLVCPAGLLCACCGFHYSREDVYRIFFFSQFQADYEMTERHRKAQCALEEESDCEISEAVADLYKV